MVQGIFLSKEVFGSLYDLGFLLRLARDNKGTWRSRVVITRPELYL